MARLYRPMGDRTGRMVRFVRVHWFARNERRRDGQRVGLSPMMDAIKMIASIIGAR